MKKELYESLNRVLDKFKSSNFIDMDALNLLPVTSLDLQIFNAYYDLEPHRGEWEDWDILTFSKDGKQLEVNDYLKMKTDLKNISIEDD